MQCADAHPLGMYCADAHPLGMHCADDAALAHPLGGLHIPWLNVLGLSGVNGKLHPGGELVWQQREAVVQTQTNHPGVGYRGKCNGYKTAFFWLVRGLRGK